MEEYTEEKKARRHGWQTSTALEGHQVNKFIAEEKGEDYVALNKTKLGIMNEANYVPPVERVKELNETMRTQKQMKRDATLEKDVTLFQTQPNAPTTFTMRNKDQWKDMDPVEVARAQVEMKETLQANPYTQYSKYTETRNEGKK
ncbi:hypothetical protein AGDE_10120 [Angomonas deanei]|uniref:Uncharacterized protein n=1 Tax=Angomonas deanei TaxID=59799 RepID=A0A7G2C795_9TRYP|nr:hypothetical protein AGDE_10120 [Angomonas deanei]CAD2214911.1 hypothetical protein, conserved [Angomonas deanei]|eukprot:EPY29111.1 hypothetical protein AGDE_10120 [Angomonas deanei]